MIIAVVFPDGRVAVSEIKSINPDYIESKIISWIAESRELPVRIAVACGLLKGDKFDIVIQKGTELGAYAFFPVTTERTIVKLDPKKSRKRLERWQKIAKEAAEQSERNILPKVYSPCSLNELLQLYGDHFQLKIVAYENMDVK